MQRAHYVVYHPDRNRKEVAVEATALVDNEPVSGWQGIISIDFPAVDENKDPFVYVEPWVYSYCHAAELRRAERYSPYVQEGSILIFASGECAANKNERKLVIDTVFIVGNLQRWGRDFYDRPVLPDAYLPYANDANSPMWQEHLRFPIVFCHHTSVSHTYEARMWREGLKPFSYLPRNEHGRRVALPFSQLDGDLADWLAKKEYGKRPARISEKDALSLLDLIYAAAVVKVVGDIEPLSSSTPTVQSTCAD